MTDRMIDRTIVVTGAASGIGLAATEMVLDQGGSVLAVDIDEPALEREAQRIGSDRLAAKTVDVTSAESMGEAIAYAVEGFGKLDGAFLNAGIEGRTSPLIDIEGEEFDRVMAVNVRGVLNGLQAAGRAMRSRGGSIVITSSINGIYAMSNSGAYAASKMAVLGLARVAALDLAEHGIRVNCVHPGFVETAMFDRLVEKSGNVPRSAMKELAGQLAPIGRMAQPADVASVAVFLLSGESKYVTGASYAVDGGFSTGRIIA